MVVAKEKQRFMLLIIRKELGQKALSRLRLDQQRRWRILRDGRSFSRKEKNREVRRGKVKKKEEMATQRRKVLFGVEKSKDDDLYI